MSVYDTQELPAYTGNDTPQEAQTPPYEIRPAREADAAAIVRYVRLIGAEPGIALLREPEEKETLTVEAERERIRAFQQQPTALYLLVMCGDDVVGRVFVTAGSDQYTDHRLHVSSLSIHPEWRGMGLGPQMMQYTIDWASRIAHVRRIDLDVLPTNTRAIRMYHRLGFDIEGRHNAAFHNGETYYDVLHMALLLSR